ncbi:uncharacterized protein LOC120282184 [Dioscorea cayenensis subsp. rotundata]|uniref:Uncharacterized protein LOC120282184 n=1 Tax=Dioscorea cayennensis subsp. rotundata TaxID=55577 RepID=A0AB40D253_DIOCR|nr:uncharacterized protein LOC120282184 [Dioscorea cayenensis subsp. rotundata]
MNEWLEHNFQINCAAQPVENIIIQREDCIRPISLIVEGPSRIGKTAWARSLGKHNYICGHLDFNPATYQQDVLYNVIDDVSPAYLRLKHWKELIGCQRDWQTNCKYGKPIRIKGGIPSIILCNPGNDSSYKEYLDKLENTGLRDWTLKNAKFEFLDNPLFQSAEAQESNTSHSSGCSV